MRPSTDFDPKTDHRNPVRLLLLEDDPMAADLVRRHLAAVGWTQSQLEWVDSLDAALGRLAAGGFDLVIADLNLPDSPGGLATLDALKRATDRVVVVVSGSSEPGVRDAVLARGAYDFLHKDQLDRRSLERLVRLAAMQAMAFRSLRESEERFRSLTKLSSDWYWEQDEQFRFTYMAGTAERMALGFAAHIGKARWDLPGEADWAPHRAALERHEAFRDFEIRRVDPQGRSTWASISGEPLFDADGRFRGYRGVGSDITARKLEEAELRQFRVAMDTLADMVMLIDRETLRYIDVNHTACEMQGFTREELLARGPLDLAGFTREELEQDYDAMIASGGTTRVESWQKRKDGSRFPVEILRRAVRLAGRWVIVACFRDITARRLAEQALRESSERFRSLTDLSADMYWEQDTEYRFTVLSGRSPEPLRAGRQQMMGRRRWERSYFNMDAAAWAAHKATLDARQPFRDLELGRINEEGDEVWVSVSGEPLLDAEGRFRGYRGIGKDITQRKRNERLLALEHAVTRCLADAAGVPGALRDVMRALCESEGYEGGRYFEVDQAAGVMRLQVHWDGGHEGARRFNEAFAGMQVKPGEGNVGRVWQSGEPIWVPEIARDPRFLAREAALQAGMRSAAVFPVRFEDSVLGVFSVTGYRVRRPDERLLQAMQVIGSQVGQYLMRMRAEEDLRRFRLAMENSADMIVLVDRATMRFVDVNDTVCKLLGYSREELLSMDIERVLPMSRAELEKSYDEFIADASKVSGMRSHYICKDGSKLPFESTRRVLRSGERWIIAAISRDIRERIAAEDDLRRFRVGLDASADMVFLVDPRDTALLDFNETACRYLGYSREELLGRPASAVRVDARAGSLPAQYRDLLAGAERFDVSFAEYRRKDGSTFPVELRRQAVDTADGPMLVVNARDLTEQRRADERQSAHLRYQERIARFGQDALAKRDAAELIEGAVQNVLEGLRADAVCYVEAGGGGELVVRGLAAPADRHTHQGATPTAANPVFDVLRSGVRLVAEGRALPFDWAKGLRSAAVVPVRGSDGVRGALCAFLAEADAFGVEELNFVDAAASVLSAGLQRSDSEGRLAFLAQFDALTGLPNRALLADRFAQMIVQARRHGRPLGVLFIDLDDFKLVNDTLGHASGDELLKQVAERLQAAVRPGDTVSRIAGDEFAVVLNDMAKAEDAAPVAQKIIERLAAPMQLRGQEVFVTASIGIAGFPGDGEDPEALLGAADAAMYRAKQSGRNAFHFFTAEIDQRTRARAHLGSELRRALERDEFALAYQPKIDLRTGLPCAAEALLRWKHPERGTVSPAEFIPVLEETGLIVQVGEWVLQRACRDIRAWQAADLPPVPVAVNLSARQFRQQDLDQRIRAILESAGVPAGLIELEITESQLMNDPDHAIRVMRALSEAGIRIAIDDFGTGYSSLAYLTRFPVSSLKIDRSFVRDVLSDKAHAAIARAIIDMAHTLGFIVVAEGVETEGQAVFLRGLGCEQAQGFLFHRPMPEADFRSLLSAGAEAATTSKPPSRAARRPARRARRPSG